LAGYSDWEIPTIGFTFSAKFYMATAQKHIDIAMKFCIDLAFAQNAILKQAVGPKFWGGMG